MNTSTKRNLTHKCLDCKGHPKLSLRDIASHFEGHTIERINITKQQMISKTDEALHHIEEGKKLLEQGRFTIQDVSEKLSFLMSDLWLVMERLDSIKMTFMEKEN